jgi:hypothetical protein
MEVNRRLGTQKLTLNLPKLMRLVSVRMCRTSLNYTQYKHMTSSQVHSKEAHRESRGTAPLILGVRRRSAGDINASTALFHWKKCPYPLNSGPFGSRDRLGGLNKKTISSSCRNSNPGLSNPHPSLYTDNTTPGQVSCSTVKRKTNLPCMHGQEQLF